MPDRTRASVKKALPLVMRRAAHDLTQPVQALRMMLGLPGVVAEDGRELPRKLDAALVEVEARLAQMQALARVLDGAAEAEAARPVRFADVVALARRMRPELWGDPLLRVVGATRPLALPPRAAAWCVNALLDNARRARPKSRIVVGVRAGERRVVVADDGDGMNRATLAALRRALGGGDAGGLGIGLALAAALVAEWGGDWRVDARDGGGACVGFSAAGSPG